METGLPNRRGIGVAPSVPVVTSRSGAGCVDLLDERWDSLLFQQRFHNPTLSAAWLRRLVEREEGVPLVVTVEQSGVLVAGGAFGLYRPAARVGPVLARWLGYPDPSFQPDLLVASGAPYAAAAVVDAVLDRVDAIHAPSLADGALAAALADRTPWRTESPGFDTWVVPLPAPRRDYAAKRCSFERRRAVRGGTVIGERVLAHPDEIAAGLERLFELHRRRWDGDPRDESRFSKTEPHRQWHRRLVAELAGYGEARIAEVVEDDDVVATSLGFTAGTGAILHTHVARRGTRMRGPGHASLLLLAEALHEAGATSFDLGAGPYERGGHKDRLGPTRVRVPRFLAASSRRRQGPIAAALAARDAARRLRKRRSPR